MSNWADRLGVFDLETTGIDVDTARIVSACVAVIDADGELEQRWDWLADPGIEIPAAASEVHGITTDRVRTEGRLSDVVVAEIAQTLRALSAIQVPIVIFNAPYDLSVLDRECRRHGIVPLGELTPVIDPLVLDKAVDRYRKGKRTLEAAAELYEVTLEDAHDAGADAIAAGRVAQALSRTYSDQLGIPAEELHAKQTSWYAEQAARFQDYIRRVKGDESFVASTSWPVKLPDHAGAFRDTQPIPPLPPRPSGRTPVLDFTRPLELQLAPPPTPAGFGLGAAPERGAIAAAAPPPPPVFDEPVLAESDDDDDLGWGDGPVATEPADASDDRVIEVIEEVEVIEVVRRFSILDVAAEHAEGVAPAAGAPEHEEAPEPEVEQQHPAEPTVDERDHPAPTAEPAYQHLPPPVPVYAAPTVEMSLPIPPIDDETDGIDDLVPDPVAARPPAVLRIAAGIVSDSDGRFLLVRKRDSEMFIQPGGKIESGESAIEALARELDEELGIAVDTSDAEYLGLFRAPAANEDDTVVLAAVFAVTADHDLVPGHEIEELRWIERLDQVDVELAPLTRDDLLPLWASRRAGARSV